MIRSFLNRNWLKIYNTQMILFSSFIILSFIYYWNKSTHIYFNKSIEEFNFQSIFSFFITCLFAIFFANIFIYPILLLLQYGLINREIHKSKIKNIVLLFVLYLISIVLVLALLTIGNTQAIK